MYHAQVNPDNTVSLIDLEAAYPNGAMDVVKPILEEQGYIFIELESAVLPGDRYDREKKEFWTYKPPEALPTEIEILTKKVDALTNLIIPISMTNVEPPKPPNTPPDELPPLPSLNSLPPLTDVMGMMGSVEPPETIS